MLRIGLTGGIGSGKSTAAQEFRNLGVPVIDSDQIARELVAPGQPALEQITRHFGKQLLSSNGELDRDALRKLVMQDASAKSWLENLLHPLIEKRRREIIESIEAPYLVLEIPLLLESGLSKMVDRILVVDLPEALQLERTRQRSGMEDAEIRAIMNTQADRQRRLDAADDVIDNSGTPATLKASVNKLHRRYLELSGSACASNSTIA